MFFDQCRSFHNGSRSLQRSMFVLCYLQQQDLRPLQYSTQTDRHQQLVRCNAAVVCCQGSRVSWQRYRSLLSFSVDICVTHLDPYCVNTKWAKNWTILKVCNSCIWWYRKTFYISACSVHFSNKTDILNFITVKFFLH